MNVKGSPRKIYFAGHVDISARVEIPQAPARVSGVLTSVLLHASTLYGVLTSVLPHASTLYGCPILPRFWEGWVS